MITGLQLQRSCMFHGQDNKTIHQSTRGHRSPAENAQCLRTRQRKNSFTAVYDESQFHTEQMCF